MNSKKENPKTKVWFITGISRGFGRELASAALQNGDLVIGTTRNGQSDLLASPERLRVLGLDVSRGEHVAPVVQKAWQIHGHIDVVVNNAGFGLLGAVEEVEETQARQIFDTNFFGTLSVIQTFLPLLRAQGSGHIINISSVAGFSGFAGYGLYNASKFAVEGLSEALASELQPLGIHVTIVEPGYFRTNFLSDSSLQRAVRFIDAYAASSGKTRESADERDGKQPGNPALAAKAIIAVTEAQNPPLRLILGADAVERVRAKLTQVAEDLETWESTSVNTAYTTAAKARPAEKSGTFAIGGNLPVHRLGFGSMQLTGPGVWGEPADRAEAIAVLRRAADLGINLIDTADSYGPHVSENLIREALYPYPPGLVIATKAGLLRTGPNQWTPLGRPEYLRQECEMSLRRLKVERIDLFQLHRIDPNVPAEDQFGLLAELQKQGKVRHVGLSEVNVTEIEAARRVLPIVTVQNLYNLANRRSEDVLDYCTREGIGFIPWFPLATGNLAKPGSVLQRIADRLGAQPAQIALAWLLRKSGVMLPIPGTSKVNHLEENASAAELELDDSIMSELEALARTASRPVIAA
jgi:aryl-alcohol dehydrogenase-like predicted oxidoreductase/NAD(P)-dependent dehydrogenase (short-subunit alcohol dehydrogenase family)